VSAFYAELIGFVIFIGLIAWQIVPRVLPLLDRRRDAIRSSIEGAVSIREAAERERDRRLQMLDEARREADAIIEQARGTAAEIGEDGHRRAVEEHERLVRDAQAEIELQRRRAREEMAAAIGVIVVDAAEQVVLAEVDASLQHSLVTDVIEAAERAAVGA
jgi:F-type H+-transporting ATPase subunit b